MADKHLEEADSGTNILTSTDTFQELEDSLLSFEKLDRTSPEIWPEKRNDSPFPGMSDFISMYSPPSNLRPVYSKNFTAEDKNLLHQYAALSTSALIAKVKELHDIAYQLGVEESKEMTRGKYLNIFKSRNKVE